MARDFKTGAQKASEAGRIHETIKERTTPTEKPAKLPRVNLALSPEAFDYIKTVSKATGQTQQAFIQMIINKYMAEHKETYKAAKKLLNSL
jgi:predicted DNA binding CopG/RHH family protein